MKPNEEDSSVCGDIIAQLQRLILQERLTQHTQTNESQMTTGDNTTDNVSATALSTLCRSCDGDQVIEVWLHVEEHFIEEEAIRGQNDYVLLEQWNIDIKKEISISEANQQHCTSDQMLVQAIKSKLYFSQLSAWLNLTKGKFPKHSYIRFCSQSYKTPLQRFLRSPEYHQFPHVPIYPSKSLQVTLHSLPRFDIWEEYPMLRWLLTDISTETPWKVPRNKRAATPMASNEILGIERNEAKNIARSLRFSESFSENGREIAQAKPEILRDADKTFLSGDNTLQAQSFVCKMPPSCDNSDYGKRTDENWSGRRDYHSCKSARSLCSGKIPDNGSYVKKDPLTCVKTCRGKLCKDILLTAEKANVESSQMKTDVSEICTSFEHFDCNQSGELLQDSCVKTPSFKTSRTNPKESYEALAEDSQRESKRKTNSQKLKGFLKNEQEFQDVLYFEPQEYSAGECFCESCWQLKAGYDCKAENISPFGKKSSPQDPKSPGKGHILETSNTTDLESSRFLRKDCNCQEHSGCTSKTFSIPCKKCLSQDSRFLRKEHGCYDERSNLDSGKDFDGRLSDDCSWQEGENRTLENWDLMWPYVTGHQGLSEDLEGVLPRMRDVLEKDLSSKLNETIFRCSNVEKNSSDEGRKGKKTNEAKEISKDNVFSEQRSSSQCLAPAQLRFHSRHASTGTLPIFNQNTGLPMSSSPAPLRKTEELVTVDDFRGISGAFGLHKMPSVLSRSAPTLTTQGLLCNFEESVLNDRLLPDGVVEGFRAELSASSSTKYLTHVTLPVQAYFFKLSDDNAPSPYMGYISLDVPDLPRKGYHVPKTGTIQLTLFNPNQTVVKVFFVLYDFSDMKPNFQTFLRQKITSLNPEDLVNRNQYILHYLIHLRFASSKSGRVYLHTDIRLLFPRHPPDKTDFEITTNGPTNPKYVPKQEMKNSQV